MTVNCITGRIEPPTPEQIRENLRRYPLKEMLRRGWIRGSIKDTAQMQSELERFFARIELKRCSKCGFEYERGAGAYCPGCRTVEP